MAFTAPLSDWASPGLLSISNYTQQAANNKEERGLQRGVPQWTALHEKQDEMKKIVPAKEKGNVIGWDVHNEAQIKLWTP